MVVSTNALNKKLNSTVHKNAFLNDITYETNATDELKL